MSEFLPDDYRKAILEEIRRKEIWLGDGKAESIERYREVAGRIKGLKNSLDIFKNVIKMHGVEDYE